MIKKIFNVVEKLIPPPPSSLHYNPALDGIRAIAVLLVILGHYFPGKVSFGYVGVDVFFLLSGYLITTIILRNILSEKFSFKKFYRNRIRRLFPAMIILLVFCLILGYLFVPSVFYKQIGEHVFFTGIYLQNFKLASEVGYFDLSRVYKPLLHTWSLAVEEQFYLLFPLLLFFLCKRCSGRFSVVLRWLAILGVVSLLMSAYWQHSFPQTAYYMPFGRFWEFLMGALLALFLIYKKEKKIVLSGLFSRNVILWESILLIFTFAFACFFLREYNPIYLSIYLSIWIVLFVSAVINEEKSLLAFPVLVWTGRISYSLYLWHYVLLSFSFLIPIIPILGHENINYVRVCKLFLIVFSFFLAVLFYRLVEYPLRKIKSFSKVITLWFILIIVAVLGLIVYLKDGLPKRKYALFTPVVKNLKDFLPYPNKNDNCIKLIKSLGEKDIKFDYCLSDTSQNDLDVLILGDSHSKQLYYGFERYFGDNLRYAEIGISSWPATFKAIGSNLRKAVEQEEEIKQVFAILPKLKFKFLLIVTRNAEYFYGKDIDLSKKHKFLQCFIDGKDCDNEKVYVLQLKKTLDFLRKLSYKKIYFLYENPALDFDPRFSAVKYEIWIPFTERTKMPSYLFFDKEKEIRESLSSVFKLYNVIPLNTDAIFCDGKYCYAFKDGMTLYYDDDHLSKYGAYLVVKYISNSFLKAVQPSVLKKSR
ncbi:Peptidoglycan/LPS O-acetylase OafA/YrhL, contains acyltransferase and SGNH-hydrolase domains [Desulfurobacterium pacificum]|uniref:Peptidoglycan/LPS O-acetylase OafA/YrhL, contains acyltransferase and SGNH-hydrolase domains n=1 Tax=Desulfurobacterium pacificum TaxID=240166 RepID=A0ABY1NPQ2_9BACT|nr:acyltransferase family protein [Desulfurobacterium pacificum]SMP14278.1 Peptidoglycan/LPS O-acetylase OafA/YrhL, contains acyltransferase and SGNH-hydrolase domains [Desulfurobacterium pacificum]